MSRTKYPLDKTVNVVYPVCEITERSMLDTVGGLEETLGTLCYAKENPERSPGRHIFTLP